MKGPVPGFVPPKGQRHSLGHCSLAHRDWGTTMKGRTVNFYVDPESLPEVLRAMDEDVIPRFREVPHFVGVVVLQSQRGSRIEIAGISLWDGDLEDSEEIAAEFRREVHRLAGTGAARTAYEVIRLELRGDTTEITG